MGKVQCPKCGDIYNHGKLIQFRRVFICRECRLVLHWGWFWGRLKRVESFEEYSGVLDNRMGEWLVQQRICDLEEEAGKLYGTRFAKHSEDELAELRRRLLRDSRFHRIDIPVLDLMECSPDGRWFAGLSKDFKQKDRYRKLKIYDGSLGTGDYEVRNLKQLAVSNVGSVVMFEGTGRYDKAIDLYVVSNTAEKLLHRTIDQSIHSIGISNDGAVVAFQVRESGPTNEPLLTLFDVIRKKKINSFIVSSGWASSFRINNIENKIHLSYEGKGEYCYTFDGEFIDRVRFYDELIRGSTGPALFKVVDMMVKGTDPAQLANGSDFFIEKLLFSLNNYSPQKDHRDEANRLIGQLFEVRGDIQNAIKYYESALMLNERIGLKGKIKELKKKLDSEKSNHDTM